MSRCLRRWMRRGWRFGRWWGKERRLGRRCGRDVVSSDRGSSNVKPCQEFECFTYCAVRYFVWAQILDAWPCHDSVPRASSSRRNEIPQTSSTYQDLRLCIYTTHPSIIHSQPKPMPSCAQPHASKCPRVPRGRVCVKKSSRCQTPSLEKDMMPMPPHPTQRKIDITIASAESRRPTCFVIEMATLDCCCTGASLLLLPPIPDWMADEMPLPSVELG